MGVQSFDDDLLREMQRFDKYGSGADIVAALQREGDTFDTLNVDMIFNFRAPNRGIATTRPVHTDR